MQMNPNQFYQHAEKISAQPELSHSVYLFYGEESFLVNQAARYLKQTVLSPEAEDFNFSAYFSADADLDRVKEEVETFPIFAEKRVIWVREIDELNDKDWEKILPILENPVSSAVLILCGNKPDKRKRALKLILDKHSSVEFKKPYENEIPGWIRKLSKDQGLTISEEASALLHRLVGSRLTELNAEIVKLASYVGERKKIELEDVAKCVSDSRELSVFELTNSFARGDKIESLSNLVRLMDQGQNAIGIVSLLARHIRILIAIKQGQSQGLSGVKLASFAGVPGYFLKDYLSQAQHWSFQKLEDILVLLADTDRALKSSPLSSHIWLENLVLKSC